jgi:SRSO17 transposase
VAYWTIAEHAGDANPDGMQHLLARAVWDHDAVRDDVRDCVVEHLGAPEAVLVVDETGDLKKGPYVDVGIGCLMTSAWLCRTSR